MTTVISNDEYGSAKEERLNLVFRRDYQSDGVHKFVHNPLLPVGWNEKIVPWGEKVDVKQCAKCEEFQSTNSPPICFGCATGLR